MSKLAAKYLVMASALIFVPVVAWSNILKSVPKGLLSETPYDADLEPDINITNVVGTPTKGDGEIKLDADEFEADSANGLVIARGDVNITKDGMILKADEIAYDQKTDKIIARGKVSLYEPTGNTIYADNIDLEDKMSKISMESIKVIMRDKSQLYADNFRQYKNNNKLLEGVIYTPCDVCEESNPLWRIRARKVRHNAEKKDLNYNDAFLEIKGVPVLYTPFFSHPDPTVKRRSGWLPPNLISNNYFGPRIMAKYFWAISDNEDMLLSPGFSAEMGPIIAADYNKFFRNGEMHLSGTYFKDNKHEGYGNGNRGNLYAKGRYEINENWVSKADIKYVSDRTLLKDLSLKERDDAWINSTVKAQGFYDRNYMGIEAYHYKQVSYDLRQEDKPYIVPLVEYENIGEINKYGFYNRNEFSLASIYREERDSSYRASAINSLVLPYTTSYGAKTNLMASLKTDFYYIDNFTNVKNENIDSDVFRVFPQLSYEWRMPFVKGTETSRQIIEPILIGVLSPNGNNKNNMIPNNDSRNARLDDTNILDVNRYAGYDINDNGSRISYGINWSSYGDVMGRSSFLVAQSYKFKRGNNFSNEEENDGYLSNYVGRFYANPNEYLDFSYRFILDRKDYELEYNELSARMGSNVLNANIGYIFLKDSNRDAVSITNMGERKELYISVNMALARYWYLSIYNRQDLTRGGGSLEHGGSLKYEDECFSVVTSVKKDRSNDPKYKDDYEFNLSFYFKTLGGVGTK